MTNDKSSKGGVKSRSSLYARASKHAPRAIERLAELMESRNPSVAMGAAKVLLAKALPDLKAVEWKGDSTKPLIIKLDGSPTISVPTKATSGVGSSEESEE